MTRRVTLRRHDWARIMRDLSGAGWCLDRIAKSVGHSKTWASNLRTGVQADPGHRDGEVLLLLWSQATGRQQSDAPRHDPFRIPYQSGDSLGAT